MNLIHQAIKASQVPSETMIASFLLSILSAVLVTTNSVSHAILLERDTPTSSYQLSLEARGKDNFLQNRGLRLSKSAESALRRAHDQKQIASPPKQDHDTRETTNKRPGQMNPASNIINAGKKTLSQTAVSGKMILPDKVSQSSRVTSSPAFKRPAGGGFIGHSRIPPRIPEPYSGVGAMQIPAPPWETARKQPSKQKVDSKTDQSQTRSQKHTSPAAQKESEKAFDPFEGMPLHRQRPPALTSIDDF